MHDTIKDLIQSLENSKDNYISGTTDCGSYVAFNRNGHIHILALNRKTLNHLYPIDLYIDSSESVTTSTNIAKSEQTYNLDTSVDDILRLYTSAMSYLRLRDVQDLSLLQVLYKEANKPTFLLNVKLEFLPSFLDNNAVNFETCLKQNWVTVQKESSEDIIHLDIGNKIKTEIRYSAQTFTTEKLRYRTVDDITLADIIADILIDDVKLSLYTTLTELFALPNSLVTLEHMDSLYVYHKIDSVTLHIYRRGKDGIKRVIIDRNGTAILGKQRKSLPSSTNTNRLTELLDEVSVYDTYYEYQLPEKVRAVLRIYELK